MVAMRRRPPPAAAPAPENWLADNLRRLRGERGLTLEALALRCGVSRAMISKIERGEATPTATVLGKLAAGLEIGLSQLVGERRPRAPVLLPRADQAVYRDPESGLERRSLTPLFPDRALDLALNTLPAGGHVVFPPHHAGVEEYLCVSRGALVVLIDGARYDIAEGGTLFYPGHAVHEYRNETAETVEFYVVVDGASAR